MFKFKFYLILILYKFDTWHQDYFRKLVTKFRSNQTPNLETKQSFKNALFIYRFIRSAL